MQNLWVVLYNLSIYNTLQRLVKEAVIKEEDGRFVLYTSNGSRVLGTHPTKEKALAQERAIQFHKHAAIIGIPDKSDFGNISDLPLYKKLMFVVQKHNANKAKLHYDIRLGDKELHSFVSKKGLPGLGEKRLFIHQPLHDPSYAKFEGTIPSGYGAGTVETEEVGSAVVTKAEPNRVNFTLLHRKSPENFSLVRTGGKNWLAINTSPTNPHKLLQHREAFSKLKMLSPKRINEQEFAKTHLVSAKLSGASNLFRLKRDGVDVISYRVSKSGRPIIHTEAFMGLDKHNISIPDSLVGTIIRGELIGLRKGKAISEQALGGLLNSSAEKSLQKQKDLGINLKAALFDIVGFKGLPIDRQKKIREILKHLPKQKFMEPPYARNPKEALQMIRDIKAGRNKLTSEGVVGWPLNGGTPVKHKNYKENDAYFRGFSQGLGRLENKGVGAIKYSLTPKGKIVGEVASGLTDFTRRDIYDNPEDYIGRVVNIKHRGQMGSGAFFQPTYLAMHDSK